MIVSVKNIVFLVFFYLNSLNNLKPRLQCLSNNAVWCAGVKVGDWWMTRIECSAAGVHRPTVAGISGRMGEGCYSIALSGGYEDDIDCGEYFTYTGKFAGYF